MRNLLIATFLFVLFNSFLFAEDSPTLLRFYHTHTKETFTLDYRQNQNYSPSELEQLQYFLRDHRTNEIYIIDTALLNILYLLKQKTKSNGVIEIISAYRSVRTNEMLRKKSSGVVKNSLHLQGQAIDIRFSDIESKQLYKVAKSLQLGGVGYYPSSNFIHIDVGRVRFW